MSSRFQQRHRSVNTHKRPYAFPEDVHHHGNEPAPRLTRSEYEEGDLNAMRLDGAVRKERHAIRNHVLSEVDERDNVRRDRAVRVD